MFRVGGVGGPQLRDATNPNAFCQLRLMEDSEFRVFRV